MNYVRSHKISFYISILVALIFISVFALISWLSDEKTPWFIVVLSSILVVPISYLLYRYILDKFIYDRIRLIYKTIHNLKSPKGTKIIENRRQDILEKANQEVMEWAETKVREVEDLKKLESYRREFLGNISHELKTPIFNIQGYVLTLLDGGMDDPNINRKFLERTEQSVNRMISIIEDLEAISRLEAGELKLNFTHFNIIDLCKDVFDFLEIKAQEKGIRLQFEKTSRYEVPVFVYADRERIHQVITNLVYNSIKYGVSNGATSVGFFDMDENILIEVTDSGAGIPPKEIPRLFERFYRGDRSRSRQGDEGGSGLGLAIVKHIIEAHEQTINVRSTLGVGSTFAFTLKKGRVSTENRLRNPLGLL